MPPGNPLSLGINQASQGVGPAPPAPGNPLSMADGSGGGGFREAFQRFRNPSDQRRSVGMAMMGLGQGLLSQGPRESWGVALGRGIGQAGQNYEQQGKRNRASRFRDHIRERMESGNIDPTTGEMLMGLEPGQAASSMLQLQGMEQRGSQFDRSLIQDQLQSDRDFTAGQQRAAASEQRAQTELGFRRRGEGRQIEAAELSGERFDYAKRKDVATAGAREELNRPKRIGGLIDLARGGDPGARQTLGEEMGWPVDSWDSEATEHPGVKRFVQSREGDMSFQELMLKMMLGDDPDPIPE